MARADVNVQSVTSTPAALTFTTLVVGVGNGAKVLNHNGRQKLLFKNPSGVTASDVKIISSGTIQGLDLEDLEFTVPAGAVWSVDDLEPSLYNSGNDLLIECTTQAIDIAVVHN